MSTESREHLSCLMDGEISRETGRFLVRRLGADEELCATWARYHLVRDCLRDQEAGLAGTELSGRIRLAIEQESVPAAPRRRAPAWLKPAAGMAVAASVALMAIVAVGPGRQVVDPSTTAEDEVAAVENFTSPQGLRPMTNTRQASLSGGAGGNRMNPYLLRHYQATGSASGKGFVTFVPIVITTAAEAGETSAAATDAERVPAAEADEAAPSQ